MPLILHLYLVGYLLISAKLMKYVWVLNHRVIFAVKNAHSSIKRVAPPPNISANP
jgi:hypothetical protein